MKRATRATKTKPKASPESERPVSQGRHESQCSICAHPQREAIEQAFIGWVSTTKIAEEYSVCRDGVYLPSTGELQEPIFLRG